LKGRAVEGDQSFRSVIVRAYADFVYGVETVRKMAKVGRAHLIELSQENRELDLRTKRSADLDRLRGNLPFFGGLIKAGFCHRSILKTSLTYGPFSYIRRVPKSATKYEGNRSMNANFCGVHIRYGRKIVYIFLCFNVFDPGGYQRM
jgi:hypothetical protein